MLYALTIRLDEHIRVFPQQTEQNIDRSANTSVLFLLVLNFFPVSDKFVGILKPPINNMYEKGWHVHEKIKLKLKHKYARFGRISNYGKHDFGANWLERSGLCNSLLPLCPSMMQRNVSRTECKVLLLYCLVCIVSEESQLIAWWCDVPESTKQIIFHSNNWRCRTYSS